MKKRVYKFIGVVAMIYLLLGIALFLLQDKFLFHPQAIPQDHVYDFNKKFDEINIRSGKNVVNVVRFYTPDSLKKGAVLYLHGNRNNIERYESYTEIFLRNGYDVWMPDYPGFGKSTGTRTETGLYKLAQDVYDQMTGPQSSSEIIIYGRSLGTGIAANLAANNNCANLILETPYYSMESLFSHYAFMYPVKWMINYELPTFKHLQKVKDPVTIFHGTNDEVIPYKNAEKLKRFLKEGDKFIKIEQGRHNNLYDSKLYQSEMEQILQ